MLLCQPACRCHSRPHSRLLPPARGRSPFRPTCSASCPCPSSRRASSRTTSSSPSSPAARISRRPSTLSSRTCLPSTAASTSRAWPGATFRPRSVRRSHLQVTPPTAPRLRARSSRRCQVCCGRTFRPRPISRRTSVRPCTAWTTRSRASSPRSCSTAARRRGSTRSA